MWGVFSFRGQNILLKEFLIEYPLNKAAGHVPSQMMALGDKSCVYHGSGRLSNIELGTKELVKDVDCTNGLPR